MLLKVPKADYLALGNSLVNRLASVTAPWQTLLNNFNSDISKLNLGDLYNSLMQTVDNLLNVRTSSYPNSPLVDLENILYRPLK